MLYILFGAQNIFLGERTNSTGNHRAEPIIGITAGKLSRTTGMVKYSQVISILINFLFCKKSKHARINAAVVFF